MTKAEEKAIAYQLATHGPNVIGGEAVLSDEEHKYWNINYDFKAGYEEAEKDLGWHSVEESLPPMDEEVIVLSNIVNGHYISSARRISFGHIVNKEICVDYDGWNIPGVKYWMPCPKLPED